MERKIFQRWDILCALLIACYLQGTTGETNTGSCSGKLKSARMVTHIKTPLGRNAGWMKDPLQVSDRLYYMGYDEFELTSHLFEYETIASLKGEETAKAFYSLPQAAAGTGFVVYDRSIFYVPESTKKVVRFDLATQSIEAEVEIPEANCGGTSPYSIELSTDIDLAVDENGLWVIYATEYNDGNIVISRLEHQTLAIKQTWTTDYYKLSALNAFMVCGVLYTVNSNSFRIDYMFNTTYNVGTNIDVYLPNLGRDTSSMHYNPKEARLYVWNNRNAVAYQLEFEKIIPSTTPPALPPTVVTTQPTTTRKTAKTQTPPEIGSLPPHTRTSTRSPWVKTTSSAAPSTNAAPLSNSRHLVMLRVGLTISICLLVVAGVIIFFCVLPSEKREYFRSCCFGYSNKSSGGRYQYTGSISNTLYGGQLGGTGFTGATYVGESPTNYCRSCSSVTACTTTLLPTGETQPPLLHKPPMERATRSMSEMDVGRVNGGATRYSHNTVAHSGYTRHLPTSSCACYNHLHEECPCGTFCPLPPRNCVDPALQSLRNESDHFRQSPHHYETVDKNFANESTQHLIPPPLSPDEDTPEQIYQSGGYRNCAASSSQIDVDPPALFSDQSCTLENPSYAAHVTPDYGRPRSVESAPAPRPRIKMGTSGLQLYHGRAEFDASPARPGSGGVQSYQDKRSSDPLSMDLGYVTDNQNLDCSQCGQAHSEGCAECRSPVSDLPKPALLVRSLGNGCSRDRLNLQHEASVLPVHCRTEMRPRRTSVHNTSDFSDCPSENDREVERIVNCNGAGNTARNTMINNGDNEMIETDKGGRISAAETVTSWSAYAGSEGTGDNSTYGSNVPCNKKRPDLTNVHSQPPHPQDLVAPRNKKYTYTLPGTAANVTKAKIDLKAGGISMITNI